MTTSEPEEKDVVGPPSRTSMSKENIVLTSEDAMRELFKESTIIIENARENVNLHTGVFSVSRLLWKKSFVLLLSSLYCFVFNGVFGSVLPSYVDGETTNAIESYICAVLLLLKLLLLVFLERRQKICS